VLEVHPSLQVDARTQAAAHNLDNAVDHSQGPAEVGDLVVHTLSAVAVALLCLLEVAHNQVVVVLRVAEGHILEAVPLLVGRSHDLVVGHIQVEAGHTQEAAVHNRVAVVGLPVEDRSLGLVEVRSLEVEDHSLDQAVAHRYSLVEVVHILCHLHLVARSCPLAVVHRGGHEVADARIPAAVVVPVLGMAHAHTRGQASDARYSLALGEVHSHVPVAATARALDAAAVPAVVDGHNPAEEVAALEAGHYLASVGLTGKPLCPIHPWAAAYQAAVPDAIGHYGETVVSSGATGYGCHAIDYLALSEEGHQAVGHWNGPAVSAVDQQRAHHLDRARGQRCVVSSCQAVL